MDRQRRAGLLFVLPALLFFGSVFLVPLGSRSSYSFYRIAPGGASEFVGFRLYEKVLTDSTFWQAVGNTVQLLLLSVPATVVLALAVALGLNRIAESQAGAACGRRCTSCRSRRRWSRPPSSGSGSTSRCTAS